MRINPYELHIDDPEYYDEIFTGPTKPREKWAWSAAMFGTNSSVFGTIPHGEHRMRRAPLNPFFSKKSVGNLEPMIKNVVDKLCTRLRGYQRAKEAVNLRYAFAALAMDVVTDYAFAKSTNCLDEPDFAPMWPDAIDSISKQTHFIKQFPWILPLMRLMPLWLVKQLNPHIMRMISFETVCIYSTSSNAAINGHVTGPNQASYSVHGREENGTADLDPSHHLSRAHSDKRSPTRREDAATPGPRRTRNRCSRSGHNNSLPQHRSLPHPRQS